MDRSRRRANASRVLGRGLGCNFELSAARTLAGLAFACAACHGGDAGVHAIVTLDRPDASGWRTVAFDHVTVTAKWSSHVAVVCLFPRAEGQRALVVPAPSPSDPDPCADLHRGYAGVNTVYPPGSIFDDWALVANPWTLNFDGMSSGDLVTVDARAIFGGAAAVAAPVGVMHVQSSAQAERSFPVMTLAFPLPGADAFWGPHCVQGDRLDTYNDPPTFSPTDPSSGVPAACPRTENKASYARALRPVAMPTAQVGRIPPVVPSECDGGEPDGVIVWRSDPIALGPAHTPAGCVTVELDGRFAQCDPSRVPDAGDAGPPLSCPTSVRCIPPATDLVVLTGSAVVQAQNISCVPTYPEAVGYVLQVSATDVDAGQFAIGLRRRPSEGECFFDVWNSFPTIGCN
jgi:hypothetical protein